MDLDPVMGAKFEAASGSAPAVFDAFIHDLDVRMAASIERWREVIALAGNHGILGERGKGWRFDVEKTMVGRQIR